MIISDGYTIEFYPKANRIEICLPQTMTTISNTVRMVSNRRINLTDGELSAILAVVRTILDGKENR